MQILPQMSHSTLIQHCNISGYTILIYLVLVLIFIQREYMHLQCRIAQNTYLNQNQYYYFIVVISHLIIALETFSGIFLSW